MYRRITIGIAIILYILYKSAAWTVAGTVGVWIFCSFVFCHIIGWAWDEDKESYLSRNGRCNVNLIAKKARDGGGGQESLSQI